MKAGEQISDVTKSWCTKEKAEIPFLLGLETAEMLSTGYWEENFSQT